MTASLLLLAVSALAADTNNPVRIRVQAKALHSVDPRLFGQFLERPSWGETGPEIATDTNGVLSTEVVDRLRAMHIPIVRFPGGTDVDYIDWTDMISNAPGRAPERPVTTGNQGHKVTNRFGYDEYLRLAADLKWESILVVNFLDGLSKKKPLAEAARHAAGLVAYANAPVGAKLPKGMPDWPALRAKNGHPAPFGVKIFQIGNEWFGSWYAERAKQATGSDKAEVLAPWYRDCIVAYADAMRAVDPTIELIIDGSMVSNLERLVLPDPEIRKRVRYAAFHTYAPWGIKEIRRDGHVVPLESMKPAETWLALTTAPGLYDGEGLARAYGDNLNFAHSLGYEVAATEWNWNGWLAGKPDLGAGADWRHATGIGTAAFLNGLLRQADRVRLANQSMLVGHQWGIAAIRVDPTGKMPPHFNAQGSATTFYNRHHGDHLLAVQTEGVPAAGQPYKAGGIDPLPRVALLDVVATRGNGSVFVHGVNRSYDADLAAEVDLSDCRPPDGQAVLYILEGVPKDQIAMRKAWMAERSVPVTVTGGKARVVFPKRSAAILDVKGGRE